MITYEELLSEYNLNKEKLDKGEEVDPLQLMFQGYALDAVDTAAENFKINLDFSEYSIEAVERILDMLAKTMKRDKPSKDLVLKFAKTFSSYIGEVIRINWGGEWKAESEFSIKNGPALRVKGKDLFLLSKVYRRITTGVEDNVWNFYQIIKDEIQGTKKFKEVEIEEVKVKEKKTWIDRIFHR